MEIYEDVKKTGIPNFRGAKIIVPSGLNVTAWEEVEGVLSNPDVVKFVKYGFPIGFENKFIPTQTLKNHSSAVRYPAHVDKYIHKELLHGAMLGPFSTLPFSWMMVSPLMTREKSGSSDRRVIMDLSFPKDRSVNDGIPSETYLGCEFKLLLPNALTLRDRIRSEGRGACIWGRDLSRSYRQMRSCPLDYPLLGLTWRNYFFIDLAVPFGLRNGA